MVWYVMVWNVMVSSDMVWYGTQIRSNHSLQYIELLMEWVETLINDEAIFPSAPGTALLGAIQ